MKDTGHQKSGKLEPTGERNTQADMTRQCRSSQTKLRFTIATHDDDDQTLNIEYCRRSLSFSLYGDTMVCSDDYAHSPLHTCRISATCRQNRITCPAVLETTKSSRPDPVTETAINTPLLQWEFEDALRLITLDALLKNKCSLPGQPDKHQASAFPVKQNRFFRCKNAG